MVGGSFTANLNSGGLKLNVKNYKLKDNNINLDLYDAASSYENIDYTTSEENINTNLNTNDFDLGEAMSKASNQLQEIRNHQEEEKPWWEVVFDYAVTAVGSVVSGVADVVENIGDGLIMCGGELASGVASLCGNEDLASEIKKGTQDIVQYDWSEAAYDAAMEALDVDDEIAHGAVHQVGNALGSMAGYAALSLVPGGAAVTAATGFLAAKGSSAEHAFQSGATFEEASVTSTVAGAAGALSGAALNKVQGAAKGASSIKDVAKLTAKGMAVSVAEPVVNSVTEYATYGKDMTDENGNPLYDNFGDYYVESGGLLNTAIASGVGGISTGSQAIKGYKNNKATTSFVGQSDNSELSIFGKKGNGELIYSEAKKQLKSAMNGEFKGYFSKEKLKLTLDKIKVFDTYDDFWSAYCAKQNVVDNSLYGRIGGVAFDDGIYLPPNVTGNEVVHETLHGLSNNGKYSKGITQYYQENGATYRYNKLNEGYTEYLANGISGSNARAYIDTVDIVSKLDNIYSIAYGENNIIKWEYFNNDVSISQQLFDSNLGAGAYEQFVKAVEYGSSCDNKFISDQNTIQYYNELANTILDQLYLKITGG